MGASDETLAPGRSETKETPMDQESNNDRQGTRGMVDPGDAQDAFASVGLVEEPVPPSRELRSRLAATLRELPRRT